MRQTVHFIAPSETTIERSGRGCLSNSVGKHPDMSRSNRANQSGNGCGNQILNVVTADQIPAALKNGAGPNAVDPVGRTVLMLAASSNTVPSIITLSSRLEHKSTREDPRGGPLRGERRKRREADPRLRASRVRCERRWATRRRRRAGWRACSSPSSACGRS